MKAGDVSDTTHFSDYIYNYYDTFRSLSNISGIRVKTINFPAMLQVCFYFQGLRNLNNTLCRENLFGNEDWILGYCFPSVNVLLEQVVDEDRRLQFITHNPNAVFNPEQPISLDMIFTNTFEAGENCCSNHLISFHNISPNEMYSLDFLLYKLKMFHFN